MWGFLTQTPVNGVLLFQFNLGTQALDLCLQSIGLVLGSTLLEGSGSLVNKVLSILQTKAEELLNLLDHLELLSTSGLEDNIKRGLLLGLSGCTSSGTSSNSNSCSSGLDAIFIFQNLSEFVNFLYGKVD